MNVLQAVKDIFRDHPRVPPCYYQDDRQHILYEHLYSRKYQDRALEVHSLRNMSLMR